jgi:hypothetical protein
MNDEQRRAHKRSIAEQTATASSFLRMRERVRGGSRLLSRRTLLW